MRTNRRVRRAPVLNVAGNDRPFPASRFGPANPASGISAPLSPRPAGPGSGGSDSYTNTAASTACSHGISIPNVFLQTNVNATIFVS